MSFIRRLNHIDTLLEALFGPLYDKALLSVKRMRGRFILRRSAQDHDWLKSYNQNLAFKNALLKDENILNLFLSREYRTKLQNDAELRANFLQLIEARMESV